LAISFVPGSRSISYLRPPVKKPKVKPITRLGFGRMTSSSKRDGSRVSWLRLLTLSVPIKDVIELVENVYRNDSLQNSFVFGETLFESDLEIGVDSGIVSSRFSFVEF
jgi:hypothetical protein